MKKIILALIFFLFIIPLSIAYEENFSYNYVGSGNVISVVSFNAEPFPVEPGEKFDLTLTVKNLGSSVSSAICKVINKNPFSSYTESQKEWGSFLGGEEKKISFEILVDKNAVEGRDYLEIQCSASGNTWNVRKIPLDIMYRYSVINVKNVSTIPNVFSQGKQGVLKIILRNEEGLVLRDILAEINIDDVPIVPEDGLTIKKASNLNENQEKEINFNVLVLPDADSGIYKLPLKINYTDNSGNIKSFSSYVAIKINEAPTYDLYVESYSKSSGLYSINFKIANIGKSDMELVRIKLLDSEEFSSRSNPIIEVGSLDSDSSTKETILAKIEKKDETTIPLEISFRDSLNEEYSENRTLIFNKNKVLDETNSSTSSWIVFSIIILFVIYFFYKKRKKKNKKGFSRI